MRQMNNQTTFIRQGDVLLKKISEINSTSAAPIPDSKTVALGEVTGHSHSFRATDQVLLYKAPEMENPKYIKVGSGGAVLEHQEHKPILVPEGEYEVIQEQEFNPYTRAITRSRD